MPLTFARYRLGFRVRNGEGGKESGVSLAGRARCCTRP